MNSAWRMPFLLEMKVADIISRQSKHGTQFNLRNAKWYIHVLTEKIVNIDRELIPLLPLMLNKGSEYKKPFVKSGAFAKYPGEYCARHGLERPQVGGPFSCVWYTPFDPSKTAKVKEYMLDMGWTPTEWNEKKMPFQVFKYRKLLRESSTYEVFLKKLSLNSPEEAEFLDDLIENFIIGNFTGKSKNHRRAVLTGIGFSKLRQKKPITRDEVKKQLASKQFWPTSAKITEDSFEDLGEEESRTLTLLKQRMVWSHRRSLITGLIENRRPDGKLSGEANPCATPTARMKHKIIVNIPAAGAPFGKECRSLFMGNYNGTSNHMVVRKLTQPMIDSGMFRRKPNTNIMQEWDEGKKVWEDCGYCSYYVKRGYDCFVGGDGAGLELRMLTHYLVSVSRMLLADAKKRGDNRAVAKYEDSLRSAEEYREVLLNGDIHSHNQKLAGLPTRKAAKTFIYAFLYGAGDANLGGQLGGDSKVGAKLRETFLRECPCIPVLIEWVQGHAEKFGWVPAIDGRQLIMRRDTVTGQVMVHKALNTMLQAAGSIVMKYSMCFLDRWVTEKGLKCHQVIMMHDEMQFTCAAEDVPALRELIDKCVATAGIHLKMECPLASDSMWGPNWYATH